MTSIASDELMWASFWDCSGLPLLLHPGMIYCCGLSWPLQCPLGSSSCQICSSAHADNVLGMV